MRFKEFKAFLTEAEETGKYYAIGDSHAEGISYDKRVINYAHGGQPSTSQSNFGGSYNGHPTGVENVPSGSKVIVAQGCNDAANSSRAHIDSKGKTPYVSPQIIAGNVAKIVKALQSKNCKVVFVLFPNGDPKKKPYYGGEYQEKVRAAIKSAVGVPVVDMEGSALADGVHAVPSAYKKAAGEAIQLLGSASAGTASKDDTVKGQGAKPANGTVETVELNVPRGRIGPEIADVQKVLIALGYELPAHGVDGVRGSETSRAVKQFQQAVGIAVDGDPGPETVAALNKVIADKGIKITKSTSADVKAASHSDEKVEPVAYNAVTQGKIGKLLDLIAKPESGGHYDIMMGGKRNPAILKMSLDELLQYQRAYKAGGAETAAAGRYQFMPATLRSVAKGLGLDFTSDTFNPKTQDNLAIYLLQTKGLNSWLNGKMSDDAFMDRLAQVWAGLPSPSKNGASWYAGVGSNKAGISIAAVQNTLNDIKSA